MVVVVFDWFLVVVGMFLGGLVNVEVLSGFSSFAR